MILRYNITKDDWVAFNRYHCCHSAAIRKTKASYIFLILGSSIAVSVFVLPEPKLGRPILVAITVIVAVLFLPILNKVFCSLLDRNMRRLINEGDNEGVLGNHEFEIDDDGIVERTAFNETRSSWQGIERIVQTDDHIFVYISALSAHIIPKNVFPAGDTDQFVARAKQLWLTACPEKMAR